MNGLSNESPSNTVGKKKEKEEDFFFLLRLP